MASNDTPAPQKRPDSPQAPQLWAGFVDDFPEDLRRWTYRELLSDEERARHDRYRHERDRNLHLTARLMTRTVLSRCEPGISPRQWKFRPGPHGKPEIAGPEMESHSGKWHFNVTHTEGVVVLAVAQGSPVGVDVERVDRPSDFEGLARRFFAQEEAAAIAAADQGQRAALFYRIWTLKEAYVKAIGKGLAHPLDAFWFDPPDRFEIAPRLLVKTDTGDAHFETTWQARVGHVGPGQAWVVSAVAAAGRNDDTQSPAEWPIRAFDFEESLTAVRPPG
ncbi:4'-phosphopantetheinyl transferase superfamily protein [bacterium]|nr:4'-phosphopantetheinyl transferase superfamily protein [bacterium]